MAGRPQGRGATRHGRRIRRRGGRANGVTDRGSTLPLLRRASTLTRGARAVGLLSVVAGVGLLLDLPAVASLASVAALIVPLLALTRRYLNPGSAVTPVLAAFALFWFLLLLIVELLSAVSLLGSRAAWTSLLVLTALALQRVAGTRRTSVPDTRPDVLRLPPLSDALREPWTVIVAPVTLVLAVLFAQSVYLNLFTGINHSDGQTFYLARSVRYLQDGNLWTYSTTNDFLPHLHQSIAAYLLLFYASTTPLLLLSSLFGACVCLAVFELARLLRAPVSLALLAGVSPLSVTIFNLHLSTSNFDVHMALFIVLVIYFLVMAIRTAQTRYLLMAACATALALAMKLTFWFAAPGLLLLWLAALRALVRARGVRVTGEVAAIAVLVVLVGGLHFLRNAWALGFLVSPNQPQYGQSASTTLREQYEVTTFHVLASATALVTPSILVNEYRRSDLVRAFQAVNERLGITLPNSRIFTYPDRAWNDVFDHLRTPFHSDKAGFGAIVPLVIVPAVAVVVVDAVRRRAFFTLPLFLVGFSGLYLLTLSLTLKYAADHVRYLIEMVVPLLALVPAAVGRLPMTGRLPVVAGLAYLAVVGGFMATDAFQAYRNNDLRPPALVMVTPPEEQYPTFNDVTKYGVFEGARILNQQYPVEQWPEIFLLRRGANQGEYLEFPFLDVQGRRRLTSWSIDLGQARPAWPGPLLVLDPGLAEVLEQRFSEQVVLDRLSSSVWLGLPLDQLRVIWTRDQPAGFAPPSIQVVARVEPGRYQRPQFRFSAVRSLGGDPFAELRDFSGDAQFVLPWDALSPVLDLLVEVREAGQDAPAEWVRVPQRGMFKQ
jgi:hypothetical protein